MYPAFSASGLSLVAEPDTLTPKRLGPITIRLFVENNSSTPVRILLPRIVEGVMAGLEVKIVARKGEYEGTLDWTDSLGAGFREPSIAPQPDLNLLPSLVIPPGQRREIGYLNLTYWPVMNLPIVLQHKDEQISLRALDADKVCLKMRLPVLFLGPARRWRRLVLKTDELELRFIFPKHPLEADALRLIRLWDPLSPVKFTGDDERLVLRYGLPLQNHRIALDDEQFWRTIRDTFPASIYGAKAGYWFACCLESRYRSEDEAAKKRAHLKAAVAAFRWLLDNWPNTWYAHDARRRLRSLKLKR